MTTKRKGANRRTETVAVSVDPKLLFGFKLLTRRLHKTMSSAIEWGIKRAVEAETVDGCAISAIAEATWDEDPTQRLLKLGREYPQLLSYDEECEYRRLCKEMETPNAQR